jgi:hypothetical protein
MSSWPAKWANLTSIVRSGLSGPGIPLVVNKPQTPIPDNIKFYTLVEASELLNYDIKTLDVALIKYGCEIIKIPYIGGGTFIVKRDDNLPEEEMAVKRLIVKEMWRGVDGLVVIAKLVKNHPRYSYYQAIIIKSQDLLDLKKALKIHKLKAFL